jgi:putative protease
MAVKRKKRTVGKSAKGRRPAAKRKPAARSARKAARVVRKKKAAISTKPRARKREARMEKVGEVTHYFPRVKAAAVLILKDGLKIGDFVYLKGHTTSFSQRVTSLQLDHVPIQEARKGQEIGLLVKSKTRRGDTVYKA